MTQRITRWFCGSHRCDGVASNLTGFEEPRPESKRRGVLARVKGSLVELGGLAALDPCCALRLVRRLSARRDRVAGPDPRSRESFALQYKYVLKGTRKGTSHGPYCDRSWGFGITDLRSLWRRHDCRGNPLWDGSAGQVPEEATAQPGRFGNLNR